MLYYIRYILCTISIHPVTINLHKIGGNILTLTVLPMQCATASVCNGFQKPLMNTILIVGLVHLALNDCARGLEDKSQTDIIFLESAKALDKVSHQRLLKKSLLL